MTSGSEIELSIVVPVLDEEQSLPLLYEELTRSLVALGQSYELLFVDDHSTDGSLACLRDLRERDRRVRIVCFRRNFGQTAALAAGFDHARGEVVVTLDGDLQNDPADIPRFLEQIDAGFDIVAGWRKKRHDGFLLRRLPSQLANLLISFVTGTRIHDTGCTLKAFRRQIIKNMPIYAEQHRFLPAMSAGTGARVTEIVVNHRPRRFGRSKYGLGRAARVLLDLLTVKMIAQFSHRPLHYFGLFSLPFAAFALLFLVMGTVNFGTLRMEDRWWEYAFFVFVLFFLVASYFVLLGLLSELAVMASGMRRGRVLDRVISEQQ